jgi:hypothetical protein
MVNKGYLTHSRHIKAHLEAVPLDVTLTLGEDMSGKV